MLQAPNQSLLEPLLDSWDRNNIIMLNLLRALPEGGLEARRFCHGRCGVFRGRRGVSLLGKTGCRLRSSFTVEVKVHSKELVQHDK